MSNKIILSADSTCDLGNELKQKYDVHYYPFIIILDGKEYLDGINIFPTDIYNLYNEKKVLPKTAAIGVGEYISHFKKWTDNGYDVIHINIGSALSSSYQNCCLAANELNGKFFPVNSCNLSSATGLLVIEAAKKIKEGKNAKTIQKELQESTSKIHSSFIIDTLEFLKAGGRCSSLAALGANLLKLKPCIEVDNTSGSLNVGKKYRGDLDKVLMRYAKDRLENKTDIIKDDIFITHSGIPEDKINLVKSQIEKFQSGANIHVTTASCTISSHCGPNTLGVLFMTK